MREKAYFDVGRTFTSSQTGIVRVLAPVTGNLVRAFVRSDTTLDGGNALFDVNKNGTTIFGDPDDRLKILDTDQTGEVSSLAVAVNQFEDLITVDFDGFTGSAASVGGKLILVLEFEESGGGGGGSSVGARLHLTSPQGTFDDENPAHAMQWDAAVLDDGGFFDDNQFLIPSDGWYLVTVQIGFEGNATGNRRIDIVIDTGGDQIVIAQTDARGLATTAVHHMQASAIAFLETGQIIYARAWQNSGGTLDVQDVDGGGNDESWFAIAPL